MKTELNTFFNSLNYSKSIEIFKSIVKNGVVLFGASGEMGSKISSTFARASVPVIMQDIDEEKLLESKNNALNTLEKAFSKRKLSKKQLEIVKKNNLINDIVVFPERGKIPFVEIKNSQDAKDFLNKVIPDVVDKYSSSYMLLEAGPENVSFKQNIFNFFSKVLNDNAILATNTSSLKIDEIGSKVSNPERVAGFHYFLPAHTNALVEIISGSKTSPDVIFALQNLAISMGKKPIIAWKDSSGAIANRILVGVLNEAAKLYDEGLAPQTQIDKIFLETFYSKQIRIATKKAKNQFNAAPKLGFFTDEKYLYKKISECTDREKKKELLELVEGKLRQKVLYSQILENHSDLGLFFSPAPCVAKLKSKAQEQMKNIREAINNIDKPFTIKPYDFPEPSVIAREPKQSYKELANHEIASHCARNDKGLISDRLKAAYICISQQIYLEGLATIHDIELACKEGFKWNIGPFELSYLLGEEKVKALSKLANNNLSGVTGISKENEVVKVAEEDISGVQTYIQGDIAYIVLGRLHIQNLQMMQNSLGLYTLKTLKKIISNYENSSIKTIIFKSQGGGAFCSGADLEYINNLNWDTEKILAYRNLGKDLMITIADCKKVTVAVVDGPAIGGGLELALACDYRIMTDQAFVSMPEVALGIIPDWGGTERLPAIVGKNLAKRLICSSTLKNLGLKLSAEDASAVGLADALVLQSELPLFMFDLVNGKVPNVDIYKKAKAKLNYDKSDYPENIVKRFILNSPFKHSSRWFTKHAAKFAEDLIDHSHDISYAMKVDDDAAFIRLIKSGKVVSNTCIKPMLSFSQNKTIAPILEKIGIL